MDHEQLVASSAQVVIEDLDWAAARRAGLTPGERFVLEYFSDIEAETAVYTRDLLRSRLVEEPDVVGFIAIWNYEEYFHGRALARLLSECGHPLQGARAGRMLKPPGWMNALQGVFGALERRVFARDFPAVYMTWGASNELVTLRGYEALERRTSNPVLAELCRRIARQERRHFAWYYNSARERLEASAGARRLTRFALQRFWAPVGAGEKGPPASLRVLDELFPGADGDGLAAEVDARVAALPGLAGTEILASFTRKLRVSTRPSVGKRGTPAARPQAA